MPQPVSAGILSVPNDGLIRTSFHPAAPVESAVRSPSASKKQAVLPSRRVRLFSLESRRALCATVVAASRKILAVPPQAHCEARGPRTIRFKRAPQSSASLEILVEADNDAQGAHLPLRARSVIRKVLKLSHETGCSF